MPAALVEAADERGFPLLEIPYELPFIAVTEQAFTRLVNEQYALLQRSIAAQERLQRIVLSERGLESIAGALATLVGGPALVFDGRGELQAQRTFRRELDAGGGRASSARSSASARAAATRASSCPPAELAPRALALPVGAPDAPRRGLPQAWLVAAKDGGGLAEIDRLILHQAVTVDRARAAAPPRRRHDRAPPRGRRPRRRDHRRARGPRARRAGSSRSGSAAA